MHVHISSHSMEIVPSDEKNSPYISKKNVGSLLNLNGKVEIDGEVIRCYQLASLFSLTSMDCYRSKRKVKISELFSDEDSIRRAVPANIKEIHKNIIENSCGRHIIACDRFGNFLHKIASITTPKEQRFFILHSGNHVMSFNIVHKTKKIKGELINSWVVHFFDPNITNVVARSEVLNHEEFMDSSRFSLRMFINKYSYKDYFEGSKSELIENECAIYEYSDTRDASLDFSTLETLSQDGISGCMIYHIMFNNISSFDIRGVVRSRYFSTLSDDTRREIFLAKISSGASALQLAMEQNKSNSMRSYNNFLEELSCDEQVSLLPEIIGAKSSAGVPALFMAMQDGHIECINSFGLLLDRLMNIRYRIDTENFSRILFYILLGKRKDGLSALSMALLENSIDSILAFSNLMNRIFVIKDNIGSEKLFNMISSLLSYRDNIGVPGLSFALKKGNSGTVRAFGILIDKLLLMKGYVPDINMADTIFKLLSCKDNHSVPGLFFALKDGHTDTVIAFSELLDKLLVVKGCIPDTDMAGMVFKLLMPKFDEGPSGLLFSLQEMHTDTVIAFGGLLSRFALLRNSIPEGMFNSMMLDILMAARSDNIPGIFIPLSKNNIDVVGAYSSLLVYAPKKVRKEIFCIKGADGLPALYSLMLRNNPQSLIAYDCFLQALSCDEQMDLLPRLLISKNDDGDPALFIAMQEGYNNCVDAYGVLIENQLTTIRGRMSPDDFADLVLGIVLAKRSDEISALFMGVYNNRVNAIEAYSRLLDKVLSLLRGTISDDKLADIIYILISYYSPSYDESPIFTALYRGYAGSINAFALLIDKLILMKDCISSDKLVNMIFKLLKARTSSTNVDALFIALQEGNTDSITAFGLLLDKLICMKGCIEDIALVDKLFDLLMCKSGDANITGLFMAMQEGYHGSVDAFRELIKKIMIFRDGMSSEHFNNMLLETVISRRSDGISGLFMALKNNFPEVVKSYGSFLNLVPKDELVNILVAPDISGTPAALFAGREVLDSYFKVISDLPTKVIYDLYLRLNSIRRSIRNILLSNNDLDVKYEFLLKKIKEIATISKRDY
ncbi:ShET2/EspL2 family type III secretion system effector toxin [Candidatus Ichthyocystis sparus]|nr:ShET2/EspL2 family type III secretion system effector toxin [Candidatus Ichthyocystis sparus]